MVSPSASSLCFIWFCVCLTVMLTVWSPVVLPCTHLIPTLKTSVTAVGIVTVHGTYCTYLKVSHPHTHFCLDQLILFGVLLLKLSYVRVRDLHRDFEGQLLWPLTPESSSFPKFTLRCTLNRGGQTGSCPGNLCHNLCTSLVRVHSCPMWGDIGGGGIN